MNYFFAGATTSQIDSTLIAGVLAFIGLLAVQLINLAWSIYSFHQQQKDAKQQRKDAAENHQKLNELQQQINKSNRLHDHRTQNLQKGQEALIELHKAYEYLLTRIKLKAGSDHETTAVKAGEIISAMAELSGLALTAKDDELSNLLNELSKVMNPGDLTLETINTGVSRRTAVAIAQIHGHLTKQIEDASNL